MYITSRLIALALIAIAPCTHAATNVFYSTNSITIPLLSPASSYPWTVNATGVLGKIEKVIVSMNKFTHLQPVNIDIMLASPFGTNVVLFSFVNPNNALNSINITFDDDAAQGISDGVELVSGTYKPTVNITHLSQSYFKPEDPTPNATNLYTLAGKTGDGMWGLYVIDGVGDAAQAGSISNWVLTIITSDTNRPPVIEPVLPQMVAEGSNLVFHVSATDSMDNDFITLTASNLPAGLAFNATNGNTIAHGSFTWLSAAPAGVYTSQLYAADNDGTSSVDIVITVKSAAIPYPEYKITSIASSGGNLVIRWASTNLIYRLNSSTNLSLPNSFVPVVNNITGTPPENAVTTTPAAANAAYQIEIVP